MNTSLSNAEVGGSNLPSAIIYAAVAQPGTRTSALARVRAGDCTGLEQKYFKEILFPSGYAPNPAAGRGGTIWYCAGLEILFPLGYPGSNPGHGVINQDLAVHENLRFSLYPGSKAQGSCLQHESPGGGVSF